MSVRPIRTEKTLTADAAVNGGLPVGDRSYWVVPQNVSPLAVILTPAAASSGVVEVSSSPLSEIAAGGGHWEEWPDGTVSVTTSNGIFVPVNAVRPRAVTGTVTLNILGNS